MRARMQASGFGFRISFGFRGFGFRMSEPRQPGFRPALVEKSDVGNPLLALGLFGRGLGQGGLVVLDQFLDAQGVALAMTMTGQRVCPA